MLGNRQPSLFSIGPLCPWETIFNVPGTGHQRLGRSLSTDRSPDICQWVLMQKEILGEKQISETRFLSPSGSSRGEHRDQAIPCPFQGQCFPGVPVLLLGAWGMSGCCRSEHGHGVGPE